MNLYDVSTNVAYHDVEVPEELLQQAAAEFQWVKYGEGTKPETIKPGTYRDNYTATNELESLLDEVYFGSDDPTKEYRLIRTSF